jgi:hypothetical protein
MNSTSDDMKWARAAVAAMLERLTRALGLR